MHPTPLRHLGLSSDRRRHNRARPGGQPQSDLARHPVPHRHHIKSAQPPSKRLAAQRHRSLHQPQLRLRLNQCRPARRVRAQMASGQGAVELPSVLFDTGRHLREGLEQLHWSGRNHNR